MIRNIFYIFLVTVALIGVSPSQSLAQPSESLNAELFASLPILHEGRIKPMESFASAIQKNLKGSDRNATSNLVEMLFSPTTADTKPIIKIIHPDAVRFLELTPEKSRLYSYKTISSAIEKKKDLILPLLEKDKNKLTAGQKAIIKTYDKILTMGDLLNTLWILAPLPKEVIDTLPLQMKKTLVKIENPTFIDMLSFQTELEQQTKNIVEKKGSNIETYNDQERQLAYLAFTLKKIAINTQTTRLFRVIPPLNDAHSDWLTPALIKDGTKDHVLLTDWKTLVSSYQNKDWAAWNKTVKTIEEKTFNHIPNEAKLPSLKTEHLYNVVEPFQISVLLYGLSLLLLIFHSISAKFDFKKAVFFTLLIGGAFHLLGIMARIYILGRPPVSTLYESIIFVGLVTVLYGLIAYVRNKDKTLPLFIASGLGLLLHLLAFSNDQNGDNMMMLTAVLNTNFWLATHVICISIGYAFCLITSAVAHFILWQGIRTKPTIQLEQSLKKIVLWSLLLCTLGTILGGIWADQSWGRFWGWDPKENGALLIVLWLIWFIHGRLSGQMSTLVWLGGLAYLSVIVGLSWFGVNLLSVGLHAYGFTDSALWSLIGFGGFETLLIGYLFILNKKKETHLL